MEKRKPASSIDEYIDQFASEIQTRLNSLRETIKEAAPEAGEKISWGMPTFTLNGNLVHFAAHKNHIGFYPGPSGIEQFKNRLGDFTSSKGAIQFPNSSPLPLALVKEITLYRTMENNVKQTEKKSKVKEK